MPEFKEDYEIKLTIEYTIDGGQPGYSNQEQIDPFIDEYTVKIESSDSSDKSAKADKSKGVQELDPDLLPTELKNKIEAAIWEHAEEQRESAAIDRAYEAGRDRIMQA